MQKDMEQSYVYVVQISFFPRIYALKSIGNFYENIHQSIEVNPTDFATESASISLRRQRGT